MVMMYIDVLVRRNEKNLSIQSKRTMVYQIKHLCKPAETKKVFLQDIFLIYSIMENLLQKQESKVDA